ncbi:MAG: Serine/threonine-protein kinase PK-1 [Elusimicrobia bacterium ADurb.Bin231]|nr:MAG: Serine/threonine-protein kinase PK-1 [Elusimicrobia bacterium ADurb.Bin231]
MKKIFEWLLWFVILSIFGFLGFNRLINALVHHKKEVQVPNLTGKSIVDALHISSTMNLYIQKAGEDFNPLIPAGMIISQMPLPGSVVKEGKVIKVVISAGGEVVYVPKVIGETVRSAQLILRKEGLDLGEQTQKYSSDFGKGRVIAQYPVPNRSFPRGGMVNIIVSLGNVPQDKILVPDFTGRSIVEAEEWAFTYGISISSVGKVNDSHLSVNSIVRQVPDWGSAIDKTGCVELWISAPEE